MLTTYFDVAVVTTLEITEISGFYLYVSFGGTVKDNVG